MDFIDELRQHAKHVASVKADCINEAATRHFMIEPFFRLLGYNIDNPKEFFPEFTADVAERKHEKGDYSIHINGKLAIIIEAKQADNNLSHGSAQLIRYFSTQTAKFGILTNGIIYKFYTDIARENIMDSDPFMTFNLFDFNEDSVGEIKRFTKANFDVASAHSAASDLKYTNSIVTNLKSQRINPSDSFTKYMMDELKYDGTKTQQAIERFRPIVERGFNEYINNTINETLKSAIISEVNPKPQEGPEVSEQPVADNQNPPSKKSRDKLFTRDEFEAFGIIKGLLYGTINPSKLSCKNNENYISVLVDEKTTQWICRLHLDGYKKYIRFPTFAEEPFDKETRHDIESVNDIYNYQAAIVNSVKKFL